MQTFLSPLVKTTNDQMCWDFLFLYPLKMLKAQVHNNCKIANSNWEIIGENNKLKYEMHL